MLAHEWIGYCSHPEGLLEMEVVLAVETDIIDEVERKRKVMDLLGMK